MIGGKKGFTLIEVLVALAIFSVVVTISTDLFMTYQRLQRKTEAMQELNGAARNIMERIVREARENEINYGGEELAWPATTLSLKDFEDKPIIFQQVEKDLQISVDNQSASLLPKGVQLKDLKFYIMPRKNPFQFDTTDYLSHAQPFVFISMTLEKTGAQLTENTVTLQTAVSNRIYKR